MGIRPCPTYDLHGRAPSDASSLVTTAIGSCSGVGGCGSGGGLVRGYGYGHSAASGDMDIGYDGGGTCGYGLVGRESWGLNWTPASKESGDGTVSCPHLTEIRVMQRSLPVPGAATLPMAEAAAALHLSSLALKGRSTEAGGKTLKFGRPGRPGYHAGANNPLRALGPTPQVDHTVAAGPAEPGLVAFQLSEPPPAAVAQQRPPEEPLPPFGEDGCACTAAAPSEASESQISAMAFSAAESFKLTSPPPTPAAAAAAMQCDGDGVRSAQGGEAARWEGWWWELAASPPPLGSLDGMELCAEGAALRAGIPLTS